MDSNKLIYAAEARRAILNVCPQLAYCVDHVKGVDAVEVIRCRDCEKYSPFNCVNYGICGLHGRSTDGNAYCSEGKRRVNND